MTDKVESKKYCRITFKLKSPLAVGSGEGKFTDKDVIRYSNNEPYVPGSSLAGVYLNELQQDCNKSELDKYFGFVKKGSGEANSSKVLIYDAILKKDSEQKITKRDMVALDDFKTAKKGAKFDMEAVETGAEFEAFVEQNFTENERVDYIEKIISLWESGRVYLGSKTMRGYGNVEMTDLRVKEFNLNVKEDCEKWLEFDMYKDCWGDPAGFTVNPAGKRIVLALKQARGSGLSVRKYTTDVAEEKILPDYETLVIKDNVPVIPGTTWAGAFSHRFRELSELAGYEWSTFEDYLGFVKTGGDKTLAKKSAIRFNESQLKKAENIEKPFKQMTRTSIDRFSGGVIPKALFTERTYYGGSTKLVISFKEELPREFRRLLAAAITDLHYGFLSVGGLTAIGRGIFEITAINNEPLKHSDDVFKKVETALDFGSKEGV